MTTESRGQNGRRPLRIGKYDVLRHVASGGMGAVYQAFDIEAQRQVALKVLAPDMAANPKMCERFRREANAVAKLRHDNIVALYEFGEAAETYFLALEFVDGIDLLEHIRRHGKMRSELVRELLKQAVKALAHAHSQGLVHRDIKPSNFLLAEKDSQPILKLTDLGLAWDPREGEIRPARDGITLGTVDYISPEQAQDSARADVRSDIYSLGCTFYHLLTGQAPFHEGSPIERLTRHLSTLAPDIRTLAPDVPDDLVHIIQRAMRKKPEDRYQTPLDLLRDLLNPGQIFPAPRQPVDLSKRGSVHKKS
jgi:eukaryotic-like serine/threonine-protein kinase